MHNSYSPSFVSTHDDVVARNLLDTLLRPIPARFQTTLRRLHILFDIYADTCPVPLPTPSLIVTPEIRAQCECYLPLAEITSAFNLFYRSALRYPPILSSTPFYNALSWADAFAGLPPRFQYSANPALLLEKLLTDQSLLTEFLFESFLPRRFYGGFERYPEQMDFVRRWLLRRQKGPLRCLDAACGTGEDSYGLAKLLLERGFAPAETAVEGWTIEPLEVWAAAYGRFPHDRQREICFREQICRLFEAGYCSCIQFHCADLMTPPSSKPFDLILCNGLLGGPILNQTQDLERIAGNLTRLLAPGGVLLAADNFHQGWKQKYPQRMLRALFESRGMETVDAGEGFGASKSVIRT